MFFPTGLAHVKHNWDISVGYSPSECTHPPTSAGAQPKGVQLLHQKCLFASSTQNSHPVSLMLLPLLVLPLSGPLLRNRFLDPLVVPLLVRRIIADQP